MNGVGQTGVWLSLILTRIGNPVSPRNKFETWILWWHLCSLKYSTHRSLSYFRKKILDGHVNYDLLSKISLKCNVQDCRHFKYLSLESNCVLILQYSFMESHFTRSYWLTLGFRLRKSTWLQRKQIRVMDKGLSPDFDFLWNVQDFEVVHSVYSKITI